MKNEFKYTHYYLRWIFSLPCLIIAFLFNELLEKSGLNSVVYLAFTTAFMVLLLRIYYAFTCKRKLFEDMGTYCFENGILKITMGKKTFEITHVNELLGNAVKILGENQAMLFVIDNGKTYKLFSAYLEDNDGFEQSSVYPIYKLIIENSDNLEPKEIKGIQQEYWYCEKK